MPKAQSISNSHGSLPQRRRIRNFIWHLSLFVADYSTLLSRPKRQNRTDGLALVIRPHKLGDFIVWLDAAQEYKSCLSARRLVLLADKSWFSLAEKIGLWDKVIPLDFEKFGEDFKYRTSFLRQLRQYHFDTVISTSRSFRHTDVLVRFAAARKKIGPDGKEAIIPHGHELMISNRWFTEIVRLPARRETNAFALNILFARSLGCTRSHPKLPRLDTIFTTPISKRKVTPYVLFVLGAASSLRRWPISSFARIAKMLVAQTALKIMLTGTPNEYVLGRTFQEILTQKENRYVINKIGKTSLEELTYLVAGAEAVLSNETGTIHLAAVLGTPAVCIAGGGDFGHMVPYPKDLDTGGRPLPITLYNWLPCYGCGWRCIYKLATDEPAPCVSAVREEKVWESLSAILSARL